MCDLKATHMNVQCSLIRELIHDIMEATKNICCTKIGDTIQHFIRWFKNFCSGCKNFDDQTRLSRSKTVYSEAVSQVIQINLRSSTQRVSGEVDISQSRMILHLHDFGKSIRSCTLSNIAKLLTHLSNEIP